MSSIPGQIISELGEIAKNTGTEAAKAPADIAGQALESLSGATPKKTLPTNTPIGQPEHPQAEAGKKTPLEKFSETGDENIRKAIARAAIKQMAGGGEKVREPTAQEHREREERQKQEQAARQAAVAAQMAPLTPPRGKKTGDLYGIKGKQSSEANRNIRQD